MATTSYLAVTPPLRAASTAAEVDVIIQRVDSTRFPDIDVYFTVIDNVTGSDYYDLTDAAHAGHYTLVVEEKAADDAPSAFVDISGVLQGATTRSMASCLTVDRSRSMDQVLPYVKEACQSYVRDLPEGDQAAVLFFQVGSNYDGMYYQKITDDRPLLEQRCEQFASAAGGMTPLFDAWDLSITALDRPEAQLLDTQAVITLTDGWNTSSSERPNEIIALAQSYRMPIYNIAFPKVHTDSHGVVHFDNSCNKDLMVAIADPTDAAYFEPIPPYPIIPELPPAPGNLTDPAALNDGAVSQYYLEMLAFLTNLIREDDDANFADFQSAINGMLTTDAEVTSQDDLEALEPDESKLDLQAIQALNYEQLRAGAADTTTLVRATLTEEDMNSFYNDQMLTMFNKIRQSLKRLYRLSFHTEDTVLDGSQRDIRVNVSYTTYDKYKLQNIAVTGLGTGRYVKPKVAPEDGLVQVGTSVAPGNPVFATLFDGGSPPRNGTWDGDLETTAEVTLMGRWEAAGVPLFIARREVNDHIDVTDEDESANPFAPLVDEDEVKPLLVDLAKHVYADTAANEVRLELAAFTPTCVPSDPAHPQLDFPTGNPFGPGWRKKPLWYSVRPTARRQYRYTRKTTEPDAGGNPTIVTEHGVTNHVQIELPEMSVYVYDTTPPTFTVYASPDREKFNSLALLEGELHNPDVGTVSSGGLDAQTPPRPYTILLDGDYWTPELAAGMLSACSTVASTENPLSSWPLHLDAGGQVEGLFVRDDERLVMTVLVRDNYDHNDDLSWRLAPADDPTVPAHLVFPPEAPLEVAECTDGSPYLLDLTLRVAGDDAKWAGYTTAADRRSGYTIELFTDGVAEPQVVHRDLVLREPNYPVGTATGPRRHLVVTAWDRTGNRSRVEIPVWVIPVDFDARRLGGVERRK